MSDLCTELQGDRAFRQPKNVLRAIATKANSIRKLLLQLKPLDTKARREADDALKLTVTIERIASHSVNLAAADATACADLLELLLDDLDDKLVRILASQAGVQ